MHGSVQNKEKNLKIYQSLLKDGEERSIVSYCTHEKINFEGFPENGC